MNIDTFLTILNKCKRSDSMTGNLTIVCRKYDDGKKWSIITMDKTCKHCDNKSKEKELIINFKNAKDSLTIFEAQMLFMVFVTNKRPVDYASWHDCISGANFISNIESVLVTGEEYA